MKKVFFILISILLGVFVFFTVIDYKGNYVAEKAVWKITQRFNQAAKDPDAVPDSTFIKIIHDYEKFIEKFSHSEHVPMAHVLLGRAHSVKKDYESAREVFEGAITEHPDEPELGAQLVAEIGLTYIMQEDYLSVLKSYQRILKEYQFTELGLKTPILIAKFYIEQKELAQAQKAFDDAVIYYNNLIEKNPDSYIEFAALRYVATTYVTQQKWQEALDKFGVILINYSQSEYMTPLKFQNLINTMNLVSLKYLKNPDAAVILYSKFIKENPESDYVEDLTSLIEKMGEISFTEEVEVPTAVQAEVQVEVPQPILAE